MVDPDELTGSPPDSRNGVRTGAAGLRLQTTLLVIVAVILIGWALKAMATVAIPVVAAILIALAVMPVRDWVGRRVPDKLGWLGVLSAAAVLLVVVAMFFGALWLAARQVVEQLPGAAQGAQAMSEAAAGGTEDAATAPGGAVLPDLSAVVGEVVTQGVAGGAGGPEGGAGATTDQAGSAGGRAGGLLSGMGGLASRFGDTAFGVLGGVARTVLNSAVAIVSTLVMIFFLVLLILVESGDWRQKIAAITEGRTQWRLTESAEAIAQKVRTYLLIRAVLGLVTAALYGLWLWFFGAGLIIVWAILTFLLNFIPTVGSIVAGMLPVIYVLLTQDAGTAAAVAVGILVIEQIMGNVVDPMVAGSRIAVSPLVVLVALLFWAWVWGIPGALLAAPVTVSLIVLGGHVPVLRPWALLLSDRTDMQGLKEATRPR